MYIHYPFSSILEMHLIINQFDNHTSIELYSKKLHLSNSLMQMHTFLDMFKCLVNQMIQNILNHMQ